MIDRKKYIHDRFMGNCLTIGVLPMHMTKAEWAKAALPDPSNLHRPYGWVPPFAVEGDTHQPNCPCSGCLNQADMDTIYVPFCSELIAEQTILVGLDDDQFHTYIDIVDYSVSMHIIHRLVPWEEREALIDNSLFDEAEDSMRLQNAVQMALLDQQSR